MHYTKLNYRYFKHPSSQFTVVIVHGLFGSLDNVTGIKRVLVEHYNVLSLDLPDHGKSMWTDRFSFSNYADQIAQLLKALDITSAYFIGHSLGGKVCMTLALEQPQYVKKLVVGDIAPVAYERRHDSVIAGLQHVNLTQISDRGEAQIALSHFIPEPGIRQFLLKSLKREDHRWRWQFNLTLLVRDYDMLIAGLDTDRVSNIPVMFVKGEHSDYLKPVHQSRIQELFPHAEVRVIQGTGHWLHAEKPTVFARICERFFNK